MDAAVILLIIFIGFLLFTFRELKNRDSKTAREITLKALEGFLSGIGEITIWILFLASLVGGFFFLPLWLLSIVFIIILVTMK